MNTKNVISWVLRLTVAIILLQTLYYKFTGHPESVHIFSALGVEPWGRITLGIVELITAILILIPKTKILGIFNSFGIILGAIFSHLLVIGVNVENDGGTLFTLAVIVLICSSILLKLHKDEVLSLINKIRK